MIKVNINFDGACGYKIGGNIVGLGVIAKSPCFTYELAESYPYLGNNMVAEWVALIRALQLAVDIESTHGRCYFTIIGDNKPVVNHMKRIYKNVKETYRAYAQEAEDLSNSLRYVDFRWVPREKNTEADRLSKEGRLMWFQE